MRNSIPTLLAFALFCGCQVGPEHCVPWTPVPAQWNGPADGAFPTDQPVDACWWQAFNDPVLTSLVGQAQTQNLSLQAAAARIAEARAQRGFAIGGLFPNLNAIASYTRTDISDNGTPFGISFAIPPFDYWSTGFDASWELDLFGRVRRTIEAADADLDASVEQCDQLLVTLVGDVAANYALIRILQERVRFAEDNIRIQRETLRITDNRYRAGAVSELDVFQAKSNLRRTEAAIPLLRRELELTAHRLCVLLGMPPANLAEELESRPIPNPPPIIAVGLPLDLLNRRPDVRAAQQELAAQAARIGIAEADLYPRLSLLGTFTVDATEIDKWFTGDSIAYRVGPSIRWNILSFGRLISSIRVQEARWQEVAARYRETVLRAFAEAEDALSSCRQYRQSTLSLAEALEAAKNATRMAAEQYKRGAVSFQSLLDAERFQTQVQDAYVEARGNVVLSVIALYKALGGGWQWQAMAAANPATPAPPAPRDEPAPQPAAGEPPAQAT
ncbi:MAG: hypothetical protein A2W31_08840 [Planctomycetes bacterium RBG_16_64_10]|nr:MAG: hypothetical protein A2W31_08840 [Planctomycetes bacterium RBG_16_64_10]